MEIDMTYQLNNSQNGFNKGNSYATEPIKNKTNPNNLTPGTNKNKIKKEKEKKMTYFKDSIKYFNICKNINVSLGINQIKIIYSLIMISKCYAQLNDYRQAMNNINEALSLFLELSKSFKDYHSKNYNPRIMIFVEKTLGIGALTN
jgi:hypothetical protein